MVTAPHEDGQKFTLDLYDIARKTKKPTHTLPLSPWSGQHAAPQVTWTSFSPDGSLVAVARSDNRTQLFDARFLDRKLYDFVHDDPMEGTQADGISKGEWVQDRAGLQLVTSGADGALIMPL